MNQVCTIILVVFAILSLRDIFINGQAKHHEDDEASFKEFDDEPDHDKYSQDAQQNIEVDDENIEIRTPSGFGGGGKGLGTPIDMPPLRFSYCVSCGYKQAFDQFSQIVRDKYPGILIEGANYPPTQIKALLAQFIGIAKIALIVMIIMGRDPFPSLGMPTPSIYTFMLNNKLSACLMLFMLSNTLEGMLMSTGAFEIYVGNDLIWSKLESGRVPSPQELIQSIESHLELKGSKTLGASESFGFSD